MVARNTSGSNPAFFLGAVEGGIFNKYSPRMEQPLHKSLIPSLPERFKLVSRPPGVVTFEQFLFARRSSMDVAQGETTITHASNRKRRHHSGERVARNAAASWV